ncbi:VCBS domain-containing protein, partial [Alphaproteobacteria bacterium]|nr:VCBS domain-containing protein [Alphaproteobacteria bacterium]
MKIKSEFKPFQSKATYFSPLALITLAACGGGSGGVAVSGGAAAGAGGAVIKGPLENALVFIDYNQDGAQQAGEPSVRTNADGSYFIEHAAGKDNNSVYDVVAVADAGTVDASSGASAAGFTLSAPKGASVVTPTTTMIAEGAKSGVALTSADVAAALGLPAGVDPLTFNPYASGVNAADALAVEKVAQQLMTAVSAFSATLEGAGASSADAFALALNSVVEVVKDNKTAGTTLDLTDTAAVTSIGNELDSQMTANGDPAGLTKTAWNALKSDTIAAIEAVADNIQGVTSLTSSAAKGSFGNVEVLKSQVKAAATLEAANPNSGVGQIGFTNPDTVASSANNLAPTAISISKASISEAADSLVVGTITTTDADQSAGVPFKYSIAQVAGEDFAKFSIDESTGVLTILEQPDYETKSSYTVSIKSEDGGKKSLVKKLTIAVEDANDPPTLDGVTRIAAVEDAGDVTGTFSAVDANGDTLTYLVPGLGAANGVFTKQGTYGTLTLNEATGAYTYALDNAIEAVDNLLQFTPRAQVEKLTGPTVPAIAAGDKFKITVNETVVETAAATTESTLADIATMLNTANTALGAGGVAGTFAASGSDLIFTYTAGGQVSGTLGKLFFLDSSAGIAYDSGTGTGATLTVGATQFLTETFTIQVYDGNYYVSKDVTFNIKGVNDIAVLTIPADGKVTEVTDNSVVTATGVIAAADNDSDTPTVTLTGVTTITDVSGTDTYQKVGTYGTLVLTKNPTGNQVEQITAPTVPTIGSGDKFKVTLNGTDIETAVATTEATLADIATMLNTANAALASTVPGTFAAVGSDLTFTYTAVGPQSGTIGKLFYTVNAGSIDSGTGTAATLTTGTGPTITASGTGFLGLGSAGQDVTSLIDLTKIAWDVDGDGADLDYLSTGDATAVVVSDTSLKLTLSSAKYSALIAKPGFAADGIGAVNLNDKIVVLDGAFTDGAGNTQADGAKTAAVSYSDTTKPLLASFTSSSVSASGMESFALGASINITATMNEAVLAGSTITATLSTNAEVVLTAAANGTTLVGTYTVPASTSSNGLTVNSFKYTSVSDLYGAAHSAGTSGTIPGGKNLADHATMKIDTLP